MLVDPSVEELLPKAECRYSLCMLVAKRARQLVDGAKPMVEDSTPSNVTLACKEVAADKVVGIPGQHKPVVPLRPEIEEARRLAKEAAEKARLEAEGGLDPEEQGEASLENESEQAGAEDVETSDEIIEEQEEVYEEADNASEEEES